MINHLYKKKRTDTVYKIYGNKSETYNSHVLIRCNILLIAIEGHYENFNSKILFWNSKPINELDVIDRSNRNKSNSDAWNINFQYSQGKTGIYLRRWHALMKSQGKTAHRAMTCKSITRACRNVRQGKICTLKKIAFLNRVSIRSSFLFDDVN